MVVLIHRDDVAHHTIICRMPSCAAHPASHDNRQVRCGPHPATAAIGMTEITDTLVVVVSEETGQMSAVRNGEIFHNLSAKELRKKINDYLYEEREDEEFVLDQAKAEEKAFVEKKEKEKAKHSADQSVTTEE